MNLQDIFTNNLKRLRREKHITQEQLAERCGTDTAYIGQIETKKRFPSISFIERIAAALEIDSYTLFSAGCTDSTKIDTDELAEKITAVILPEIRQEIRSVLDEKQPLKTRSCL